MFATAAKGSNGDIECAAVDVRFCNRPVGVKRLQTIHRHGIWSLAGTSFSPESAPTAQALLPCADKLEPGLCACK
jgi:hypothetical protein